MKYRLPPLDEKAFAIALEAYRTAVQYERQIDMKWEPRMDEVRKSDEFSRLNCQWETETYTAEKLREFAEDVLKSSAIRGRPLPESVYVPFDKHGVEAKKVATKVRAAYAAVVRTMAKANV